MLDPKLTRHSERIAEQTADLLTVSTLSESSRCLLEHLQAALAYLQDVLREVPPLHLLPEGEPRLIWIYTLRGPLSVIDGCCLILQMHIDPALLPGIARIEQDLARAQQRLDTLLNSESWQVIT